MENKKENFCWLAGYRLEKFHEGSVKPFEVREGKGNTGLEEGFDKIWALVIGGSNPYDNASAQIGVGNGTLAANATQTGLQGESTHFAGMTTNYPTSKDEAGKMYFKSEFATNEANFAWEEWGVNEDADTKELNRKVESLGTKSGGTWSLEVYLLLQNA